MQFGPNGDPAVRFQAHKDADYSDSDFQDGRLSIDIALEGDYNERFTIDSAGLVTASVAFLSPLLTISGLSTLEQTTVTSPTYPPLLNTRTTTSVSDGSRGAQRLEFRTTQDMTDGFGPVLYFAGTDDTAGPFDFAGVGGVRDGADNTGKLIFRLVESGTYQAPTFEHTKTGTRLSAGARIGGSTNNATISQTGDLVFKGSGGMVFGHMYTNATIATTLTTQNIWYALDGDTAWTTGQVHNCTFTDPAITVLEPGMYEISWSLSTDFSATPGSKQNIEYGIMIGGAIQNEGRALRTLANSTDTGNACGMAILDLADNAVVSLGARNLTSGGKVLHVEEGNMTVKQIGGT